MMIIMDPQLKKPTFHLSHVTILGKNNFGKTRREDFERRNIFMDIKVIRDYVERIYFQFFNRIQSEYYDRNIKCVKEINFLR